jgi:inosine/xanthosine triphosphatase
MRVVVGSKNPVKINATKNAFNHYFDNVDVIGTDVDSEVGDMPNTRELTLKGAITRAKKSLNSNADVDYGVGLEGGVYTTEYGMFLFGIVVIIDKNNELGISSAEGFMLPKIVADKVTQGEELGPVMDVLLGQKDVKKNQGAIGFFTKGVISRTKSFENSIVQALIKFINKELYDKNEF